MGKLLADRKVRTEGQRRGTRYIAGGGRGGRKAKGAKREGKKAATNGRRKATKRGP